MKTRANLTVSGMFLAAAGSAFATVHYVDLNSPTPPPPYTNWASAATNVRDGAVKGSTNENVR
jgi:hypothetical protein